MGDTTNSAHVHNHHITVNTGNNVGYGDALSSGAVNVIYGSKADGGTPRKVDVPLRNEEIVGAEFQKNFDKIVGWLSSSESNIMGVYGMGGAGKTTLLRRIHNHLLAGKTNYNLQRVCWVTVSNDCDLFGLQEKIAKAVITNPELNAEDRERRTGDLLDILNSEGKVVLILDDLWAHYDVDEVGIPVGENNCKIILSTRDSNVCKRMKCTNYIVHIQPLSREESWDLFVSTLNAQEQLRSPIKEIAQKVVTECGGLPMALFHMATNLRDISDIHQWNYALNVLKDPTSEEGDAEYHRVFRSLKLSYDRLRNDTEKRCFLTCVLYAEDEVIVVGELIKIWMADGLLNSSKTKDVQVSRGHTIINKLLDSCLVIPIRVFNSEHYLGMHDLVRDMAIRITESDPQFITKAGLRLNEVPEDLWTRDLVNVSLRRNFIREIPTDMAPHCPQLTVLMLSFNPLKIIPDSFFEHMKALRVLDLCHTDMRRLPGSVCGLVDLRALLLSNCHYLEYLPSLECFTKLKVLDLSKSNKVKAPSGLGRLTELEEMYCRWATNDLIEFNECVCSQSIRNLSRYCFLLSDYPLNKIFSDFHGKEKVVRIDGVKLSNTQSTILVPDTVEAVQITACKFERGGMLPVCCGASTLKILRINKCTGLKYVLQAERAPSFCKLEEFELKQLPDVKWIIKMRVPGGMNETFSHLRKLIVNRCPQMKALFPAELLQHQTVLPCLETLAVEECEKMEVIFESPVGAAVEHTTTDIIFSPPKLQLVQLYDLPELESLYRGLLFCNSTLQLRIGDCPKLELVRSMKSLICDNSVSTLESIPTLTQDPQWWDTIRKHHQHHADTLLGHLHSHCYQPPPNFGRKHKGKEVATSSPDIICYDQQSSEDLKSEDGVPIMRETNQSFKYKREAATNKD